jgi:hypothetical protein
MTPFYARKTALAAFGLALLSPAFVRAQQPILTADAAINSAATTTNYGASTSLTISSTSTALLNFNVADMLPSGLTASQVVKARLIFYPTTVTTGGTVYLFEVNSTWSETGVTYAKKPTIATSSSGSSSINVANSFHDMDVTTLVRDWITKPSSNYGIALKGSGSTNLVIDSKENTGTGHAPTLEIVLSGPIGPAGPTGATGAKGATGGTGPQGPQGPAGTVQLPYAGYAFENGYPVFEIQNSGIGTGYYATADGIEGIGGTSVAGSGYGGTGVVGQGGPANAGDSSAYTQGGYGVKGTGGTGNPYYNGSAGSIGGPGGVFTGGPSGGSGGQGGYGLEAFDSYSNSIAVYAVGNAAGYFIGNVDVFGNLSKSGGSFKIDDPVDPANKYLYHSFVESPDMKNVYDGTVVTDGGGTATVTLPEYFESLNSDFRYQLTTIGQQAQAWVASEISDNRFVIRTDRGGVKVSWQVTGIRQDAWAQAHRIPNEVDKSDAEKGHYIHPELFGHAGEPTAMEMEHPAMPGIRHAQQQ